MSVACDDGSFSSPKSSQEGVAFPLTSAPSGVDLKVRPANTFPNEVRSKITTRYTCNAPAPLGHPLSKQRGSLQCVYNKHVRDKQQP